jgi:putative addiction module killer protein
MNYQLTTTEHFANWALNLDGSLKKRLANRLLQLESGHFGDHKALDVHLFELRCFFGGGLRVYYTIRHTQIVLLLAGGNKDTQKKDIQLAQSLLLQLED